MIQRRAKSNLSPWMVLFWFLISSINLEKSPKQKMKTRHKTKLFLQPKQIENPKNSHPNKEMDFKKPKATDKEGETISRQQDCEPKSATAASSKNTKYKSSLPSSDSVLRHIFHTKESKSLDISHLWNYNMTGLIFRDGVRLSPQEVLNQVELRRNIKLDIMPVRMKQFTENYIIDFETHMEVYYSNGPEHQSFRMFRRIFQNDSIKKEASKTFMRTFEKTKCFSRAVYRTEVWLLCVRRVPGFDFHSATENEVLLFLRCPFTKKSCLEYTFNYGAQAYFLWVFKRFFGIFYSNCSFKVNSTRSLLINLLHKESNDDSSNDGISDLAKFGSSSKDKFNEKEIQNFFGEQEKGAGQVFDHCLLSHIKIVRSGHHSLGLTFTQPFQNSMIYVNFQLNHEEELVDNPTEKEATLLSEAIHKILHLDFGLAIIIKPTGFLVLPENTLVSYLSRHSLEEMSHLFKSGRKYLCFYLDRNNFKLYVYSVSQNEHIERLEYNVGSQGKVSYFGKGLLFENDLMADFFLFVHRVKTLVIYGLKSQKINEKRIKICVDFSQKLPFTRNCGFFKWVRLSSYEAINKLEVVFFEHKNSVVLFFDGNFVTISYKEPLYEVIIKKNDFKSDDHKADSQIVQPNEKFENQEVDGGDSAPKPNQTLTDGLQISPKPNSPFDQHRPGLKRKTENDDPEVEGGITEELVKKRLRQGIKDRFGVSNEKNKNTTHILAEYDIFMASDREINRVRVNLEITKDNNPIWLSDMNCDGMVKQIMIDKSVTPIPSLRGNFLSLFDTYFELKFVSKKSIVLQIPSPPYSTQDRTKKQRKIAFQNLEKSPKGFLKITGKNNLSHKMVERMIFFEKRSGQTKRQFYIFIKLRGGSHFYIGQFDEHLERYRVLPINGLQARYIGSIFKRELLFYNGENFYSRSSDFENFGMNLNMLKIRCERVLLFEYDEGLSILFCLQGSTVLSFLRSRDNLAFEGPVPTKCDRLFLFKESNFNGVRSLGQLSKKIVVKTRSRRGVSNLMLFHIKIERGSSASATEVEKEPNTKLKARFEADSGRTATFLEDNVLFQDLNPIKKQDESGSSQSSSDSQKKIVIIEHFAEWDLEDIVISLLGTKDFQILNAIAMEQRLFLVVEVNHTGSIGINFNITESGALELIYKLSFQSMIGSNEAIKVLGVIDRMKFPTAEFSKSLILLKVLFRSQLHVLYFHPERSLLTAFPLIAREKALNSLYTACPVYLFDPQGASGGSMGRIPRELTFFFVHINNNFSIKIEKNSVKPEAFFQLKIDTFKNKRVIEVGSRNNSQKLRFRVWRFEDGQTNHLHFSEEAPRPSTIQLKHSSKFPLEIAIDLSNVRGNIFKYQLQSENHFDVQSGVLQLKPMLVEIPLFVGKSRSLTSDSRVSLNTKARLVYMYNKDLIWVNNHKGELVGQYYINRYVTCSSRLLQEFGNTISKEDVFFDAENSLLIRILRSKQLSALIIARFESPLDPVSVKDLGLTESISLDRSSTTQAKQIVVNEKLLPENYLGFKFEYQENMLLMSSQGDTSKNVSLYYYQNLLRDKDCPVSFSVVDQERLKFKVIQSVIFSNQFQASDINEMGDTVWNQPQMTDFDLSPILKESQTRQDFESMLAQRIQMDSMSLDGFSDKINKSIFDGSHFTRPPIRSPKTVAMRRETKKKLKKLEKRKIFSHSSDFYDEMKSGVSADLPQVLKRKKRISGFGSFSSDKNFSDDFGQNDRILSESRNSKHERILSGKHANLRLRHADSGYDADEDNEGAIYKERAKKKHRKKQKNSKIKQRESQFRTIQDNPKLDKEKVLIVAKYLNATLKIDFYILQNSCFVFRASQKVELESLLGNVDVARLEILARMDRVSLILLSTNYHHFVVELSYLKIHQILKIDDLEPEMFAGNSKTATKKVKEIEKIEADLMRFISIKGYTDQVLLKQKDKLPIMEFLNRVEENPNIHPHQTMDLMKQSEEFNTLRKLKKKGEDMLQRSSLFKRLAERLDTAKGLRAVKSDILRPSEVQLSSDTSMKIGPTGGSFIDIASKTQNLEGLLDDLKISKSQSSDRLPKDFRIKKFRTKSTSEVRQKLTTEMEENQDLNNLIKMYSSSLKSVEEELKSLTNLSTDAYFVNNPFQINKDADSINLAYMRGILLIIEKVEGLTKVLVYDLNRSHQVFKTDDIKPFSPVNSIGTAYMHQLQHPLCQSESESLQLMDFFQSVDHFEFLLLCNRKVFLFEGESDLSSQVLLLKVPKVFSLIVESPLLNSKFFKIGFRNPHHLIFKKLILHNEDLVNIQLNETSLRFIFLFSFVLGYCVVILVLVQGCGPSKSRSRSRKRGRRGTGTEGREGASRPNREGLEDCRNRDEINESETESEISGSGEDLEVYDSGYEGGSESEMNDNEGSENEGSVESEFVDLMTKKNN